MAKDKISKKELAGPDKFQQTTTPYLEWAHHHPKQVLLGGLALLAVIVVIGLAFGGGDGRPKGSKSGQALSSALALVDREVTIPGGAPPEPGEETFPSEQAKQEAIEAALVEVRTEYAGSEAATAALLPLADARFKLGKYDDALSGYEEYLKAARPEDPLRFLGLEGKAVTLEAKGDLAGALEAWNALAKDHPAHEDRALYGKARLFERQEKWTEARASYEELRTRYPQSPMMRLATERLAQLNVLHPAPPAAAGAAEAG